MEFVQALNPLYAVPIVAVVLCAFVVYFFGFKTPVQPPSFEGIEEERKVSKKRRTKDAQKKNLQNGKVNDNATHKAQNSGKKKDTHESSNVNSIKTSPVEKSSNAEKSDAKPAKKSRQHNDKKEVQVKKKEPIIQDDINDDGWVQLISKKGRKNRKKEEASPKSDTKTNLAKNQPAKNIEIEKSDTSAQNESMEVKAEIETVLIIEAKPGKKTKQVNKDELIVPNLKVKDEIVADNEKNETVDKQLLSEKKAFSTAEKLIEKKAPALVEKQLSVEKKDLSSLEKQQPVLEKKTSEPNLVVKSTEIATELEESKTKSKKKKKKGVEPVSQESATQINVSKTPAVQDVQKNPIEVTISSINEPKLDDKADVDQPVPEIKSTNVVFDELAGLYPEEKEQKKKKRVRRDH